MLWEKIKNYFKSKVFNVGLKVVGVVLVGISIGAAVILASDLVPYLVDFTNLGLGLTGAGIVSYIVGDNLEQFRLNREIRNFEERIAKRVAEQDQKIEHVQQLASKVKNKVKNLKEEISVSKQELTQKIEEVAEDKDSLKNDLDEAQNNLTNDFNKLHKDVNKFENKLQKSVTKLSNVVNRTKANQKILTEKLRQSERKEVLNELGKLNQKIKNDNVVNLFRNSLSRTKEIIGEELEQLGTTTETEGGGDCAFHAVKGVGDYFCFCLDVDEKRNEVAQAILNLKNDSAIFDWQKPGLAQCVKAGIQQTIVDKEYSRLAKFNLPKLTELKNEYLKAGADEFNWELGVTNDVLAEYASLIKTPRLYMYQYELGILAYVFNVPVKVYGPVNNQWKRVAIYNEHSPNEMVRVAYNGYEHFERLTIEKKQNNADMEALLKVRGGYTAPVAPRLSMEEAKDVESWDEFITSQIKKKDYAMAEKISLDAIRFYPNVIKLWQHLGLSQSVQGKDHEAIKTLQTITRLDPHNPKYWDMLVRRQFQVGDDQQAEKSYARYMRILGDSLFHEKKYHEAAQAYDTLTQCEPDNEDAWYGLSMAQNRLGNVEAAQESYEQALELASKKALLEYVKRKGHSIYQDDLKNQSVSTYDEESSILTKTSP